MPQKLDNADDDDNGEPDALSDQALELVPDGENEFVRVDEVVGEVEGVPKTDGDKDCVPQADAV